MLELYPLISNSYKSELCNIECSDGKKRIGYYTSDKVWYESGKYCDFALDCEILSWQYINDGKDSKDSKDSNDSKDSKNSRKKTQMTDDFNWDNDDNDNDDNDNDNDDNNDNNEEVEEIPDGKKGRKKGNFKGITMLSAEEGKYSFLAILKCDDPNCKKCKRKAIIQKVVTKKK